MSKNTNLPPPIIAIIGCDGSGKSTVNEHICQWVTRYGPARGVHLGKQSGNIARALAQWPLVGGWFEKTIRHKVDKTNNQIAREKSPELLPALVVTAFLQRRLHRFRNMLRLRDAGYIIVSDRFPQTSVTRAYDGPIMSANLADKTLIGRLAQREQSGFEWMASHVPDLVLRLNVDLDTACKRKPDHRREALRRKIGITPKLSYNGAPIVDIDTARPLPEVLKDAEAAVTELMNRFGYKPKAKEDRNKLPSRT